MIKIQKQQQPVPTSTIRTASEAEISKYEKDKLASIEEHAQQNRIEVIRLNGARVPIDRDTKTVNINVGDMAFKSTITSEDVDNNELFFIRCSLD